MKTKCPPDFIGIGAMRCGTTWISDKLRQHPEIFLPNNYKELHFFNSHYSNGIEWYENKFLGKTDTQISGEFTPKYLRDNESPFLIKKHYPNVKLIISIRNPIDRAFSHYNFLRKHSKISENFYQALFHEQYEIRKAGLYGQQIKTYLDLFPPDKIHIIVFDDLKKSPDNVVKKLYNFLNVSTDFKPEDLEKIINARREVRYQLLENVINKTKRSIRPYIKNRNILKKFGFHYLLAIFNTINSKKIIKKEIDYDAKKYLMEYYKNDFKICNKILNGKIAHWLNYEI
ncbi:MAG: hypothetical protein CMG64_06880 [Candidatus Marinimicrobia bacterium]|nr:hypothetical protein [Candidatus Neomarinimicrobiota bacterium]|tara:strand:- start:3818 stop:4675 length:858 start_codon:yes stop_codon:yes gene_type:complete